MAVRRNRPNLKSGNLIMNRQKRRAAKKGAQQNTFSLEDAQLQIQLQSGIALKEQGKVAEAAAVFSDIIRQKPDYIPALEQMALTCVTLGNREAYLMFSQAIVDLAPGNASGHALVGEHYLREQDYPKAIACFERSLAIVETPIVIGQLGRAHMLAGNHEKAKQYLLRSIEVDKDVSSAVYSYMNYYAENLAEDDPVFIKLRKLEKEAESNAGADQDNKKCYIYAALASACNGMKKYGESFEYAKKTAAIQFRAAPYDEGRTRASYEAVKEYFTPAFLDHYKGAGFASDTPVFIVGLPRSGTTLIDQILHSHRDVQSIGENAKFYQLAHGIYYLPPFGGKPYPYNAKPPEQKSEAPPEQIGREYCDYLAAQCPGSPRVVNKAIRTYEVLGMIKTCLPGAKFIHCLRNPLDMGVSQFMHTFETGSHRFTADLTALGRHYILYRDLMDYWHKLLPGEILDVSYEAVTDSLEENARRIIDFLGLPWDDNCLNYHETKRDISTSSLQQVRRPIYKSSVARWKRYEEHLAPLVKALGAYAPEDSLYLLK